MTESQKSKGVPPVFIDEPELTWMDEHVTELTQEYVLGQRLLHQSLVAAFVVGLAAHVGGYALLSSAPSGPLGLLADLLHALGWSLWTGVIVTIFIQVIPEVKRRQISRAVEAYEQLRGDRERAGRTTAPKSEPKSR